MSWADEGPAPHNHTVEVIVDGKVERRLIESIDGDTHQVTPVLRSGERAMHTIDGQIVIIRTNGGW